MSGLQPATFAAMMAMSAQCPPGMSGRGAMPIFHHPWVHPFGGGGMSSSAQLTALQQDPKATTGVPSGVQEATASAGGAGGADALVPTSGAGAEDALSPPSVRGRQDAHVPTSGDEVRKKSVQRAPIISSLSQTLALFLVFCFYFIFYWRRRTTAAAAAAAAAAAVRVRQGPSDTTGSPSTISR